MVFLILKKIHVKKCINYIAMAESISMHLQTTLHGVIFRVI